jgi:hypothetical protein
MDGETAATRVLELTPDRRLDENMSPVQIDVEGVQQASLDQPSDFYMFLSAYVPPEDISFLWQTEGLSLLSVYDLLGIEAGDRSDAVVCASVAAIASLERVWRSRR